MFLCCAVISTHSESRMQKLALLVCFSLTVCCLGFLFRIEAVDADSFIIGQKLIYTFVTHGMFLMLLFILEYCRFTVPSWLRWLFHTVNFVMSFAVLTLDHHPFFYRSYWAVQMDGYCVLEKEYGFLHTVVVGLFGLYMAAAVVITVIFSVKNMRRRSKYVWRILIAVLLPCVSYIIPKITGSNNDFQPMAFAAFSLMVLYMIYKNNLYDVDNIAADLSAAAMDEAIVVFDNENRYQGCNEKAEELFPVLIGAELDSRLCTEAPVFAKLLEGNTPDFRDGDAVYSVSVCPVSKGSTRQGRILKLEDVTIQRRYTDLLRASKESLESQVAMLANYSYKDYLTGLDNRRSFEETVNELRKRKTLKDVAVGYADLNGLKEVNDNVCHSAGDELIRAAAEIIQSVFASSGKAFRTGGDEFIIILTSVPENFDTLITEFEKKIKSWQGAYVDSLSISYGFAFGNSGNSETIDQLLLEADREMYISKRRYYERHGYDRRGRLL